MLFNYQGRLAPHPSYAPTFKGSETWGPADVVGDEEASSRDTFDQMRVL